MPARGSSTAELAPDSAADSRPVVISLCGTYLKPEMQSIYRQITGLTRVRNIVYAQWLENVEQFPFPRIEPLNKLHHRPKGNFIKRCWYKHIVRQWPPPVEVNKFVGPCHPWDLVQQLERDRPALVHCYYGHKAVGYLPMLRQWGGRWIVSFHGVDVAKDMDKPAHVEALREVCREARLVLARSDSLLEKLRALGCPEEKLRLNRTPIPLEHLSAQVREAPEPGRSWHLVQACRLIGKKGLMTTLAALETVVREQPKTRFILCGDGPMMEKLQAAVQHRGLSKHVELRGWTAQPELIGEYQRAHIFLHPSEMTREGDQEGIPNSMLEAMATGLPVVATQHGGIPEAVTDGHDGLLVPEKNPQALAAAILRVMREPGLLEKLSKNAATSVRAQFGAQKQVAHLEELYFEAMQS
jgi:colanic acid/amylovoran biosynthesis glycosyltransferase